MDQDNAPRWTAKHDCYRPTTNFDDLLQIVARYYEMYSKAVNFVGPWVAKQQGLSMFIPPDREQAKSGIGRVNPLISDRAHSAFIDRLIRHLAVSKGKKTLITPSPSSHHSAQFPEGTFSIEPLNEQVQLVDTAGKRPAAPSSMVVKFYGAKQAVIIENCRVNPSSIKFVILRPKLGKLGMPSTNRWEVLLFTQPHGYIIDHVDSSLNPRYSGTF